VLQNLDYWTRRRLRSFLWKQWKRGSVRFAELTQRGVDAELAAQTAGSAHGLWRLAESPGLHIALPNAYFASLGIPQLRGTRSLNPTNRRIRDPYVRWCDKEGGRPPAYVQFLVNPFPFSARKPFPVATRGAFAYS
jgi:hypothetical protein